MTSRKMSPSDIPYVMDSSLKTLRVFYPQLPSAMFYPLYRGIMASIIRDPRTRITVALSDDGKIVAYSMIADGNSMFSHGAIGAENDPTIMQAIGVSPGMGYTFNGDIMSRFGGVRLRGRHLAEFLESGGHV